jgi:hypothetical protein
MKLVRISSRSGRVHRAVLCSGGGMNPRHEPTAHPLCQTRPMRGATRTGRATDCKLCRADGSSWAALVFGVEHEIPIGHWIGH